MNNETYETLYNELTTIVNQLQSEDLDIDTSIALFKRGVEIKNKCQTILNTAQEQVVEILNEDNQLGTFNEE